LLHPTKEDIIQRFFNLGSNIKETILSAFHILLRMKGKTPTHHKTSFLMLEAIKANSLATIESSSIKVYEGRIGIFYLILKLMEIIECNASLSSQCPCDWLRTHIEKLEKDNAK
jgi:hypothetical protein